MKRKVKLMCALITVLVLVSSLTAAFARTESELDKINLIVAYLNGQAVGGDLKDLVHWEYSQESDQLWYVIRNASMSSADWKYEFEKDEESAELIKTNLVTMYDSTLEVLNAFSISDVKLRSVIFGNDNKCVCLYAGFWASDEVIAALNGEQ